MAERRTWHELSALRGVPKGRGGAHDDPRGRGARALVDAVLPHLPSPLAAAVELQWWTGMRPAEVLQLRVRDLVHLPELIAVAGS